MTITFYDITSTLPDQEWAPNPYKARFAFYYKGIPFNTEFVEFGDVEKVIKGIGAPPSSVSADGKESYTTPTIVDDSTGKKVTDSILIAQYLDETYPDKPLLFPPGTTAAIYMFQSVWHKAVVSPLIPLMLPIVYKRLTPASQTYFRETREKFFKCKIEEILPEDKRPEQLEKLKEGLSQITGAFERNGKDKQFFLGDTFSYADCICAAWLNWAKRVLDPNEWEVIAAFDEGRWDKLVSHCEKLKESA